MEKDRGSFGFTLVELMIVIAVIAVLSTVLLFGLRRAQASARDTHRTQTIKGIQTALQQYWTDNGRYPIQPIVCMIGELYCKGYLSSRPKDPSNSTDLSCSAVPMVTPLCPSTTTCWSDTGNYQGWCGASWEASYSYDSDGSQYTIILNKAGGGTVRFKSPL